MPFGKNSTQELEFLEILSVASSIVWFTSIQQATDRDNHLNQDLEYIKTHIQEIEDKVNQLISYFDK